MVMDYYAYWNGGQIRDLFEALVSICSGSSYEGLLKTAVLAGFLVTLTGALLKWQGLASKVYLFAAVLFYSVMLVPKVDVAIHDERSADVYVVSNVPFGCRHPRRTKRRCLCRKQRPVRCGILCVCHL